MVGTTTMVRKSGGIPFENSILGSVRGGTSRVASQFVADTLAELPGQVGAVIHRDPRYGYEWADIGGTHSSVCPLVL